MNKTIEALLRGYVLFEVNGHRFYRYNTALAKKNATDGTVLFKGWHLFKGWRVFFFRYAMGWKE